MKNHKPEAVQPPEQTYLQKLETATPTQAASSIIAKILLKLKKLQDN